MIGVGVGVGSDIVVIVEGGVQKFEDRRLSRFALYKSRNGYKAENDDESKYNL